MKVVNTKFVSMRMVLVLVCLLAAFGASANNKAEKSKAKLSEIHSKIESLQKQLSDTQDAHADAADALKESEKSISESNRKLYELNIKQRQNSLTLQSLQLQKSAIENALKSQKQLLSNQLYQQYLHGKQSYVQVILQEQDPGAMARQLQYFSYVLRAQADLIESMQRNLAKVANLNDETSKTLDEINSLKAKQEAEQQQLQLQKHERSKVLQKLSTQINLQRNQIEKLKRDEKSLSQLVQKLSITRPAKSARSSKRSSDEAQENAANTLQPLARNETLPSNVFENGNFSDLKGKLNLPVKGEVTNRFGTVREDTGITWKGIFIKSEEGNEVKSIAPGKIVFADWLRGFGNMVIVDHGDGYMSLYGNNQAILRKVGETVKAGDTIASVGNSGGNDATGLYYELRKQSKPFDPMSWSVVK